MTLLVSAIFPAIMLMLCGAMLSMWIYVSYRPDRTMEVVARRIGVGMLGVYLLWMALITAMQRQIPIANGGQLAAFLGLLIWSDQMFVDSRVKQRALVLLPLIAVTLLNLAGLIIGVRPAAMPEVMSGAWVAFHVTLSLAGAAMLLGAGVYGVGYLILHRQIKSRSFGHLFSRLPSMDEIHRLRKTAVYLCWALFSFSIGSATAWALANKSPDSIIHSHIREMAVLWLAVSLLALSERFRWLTQQRTALLTVAMLAVMMLVLMMTISGVLAGA